MFCVQIMYSCKCEKTVFSLKGCALYCTCVILLVIDVTVVHIGPKNIILNDDILFMS